MSMHSLTTSVKGAHLRRRTTSTIAPIITPSATAWIPSDTAAELSSVSDLIPANAREAPKKTVMHHRAVVRSMRRSLRAGGARLVGGPC